MPTNGTALLIIDMQNDFCLPGAPFEVRGGLTIVPKILELRRAFRARGLPVIFVIREHAPDGSDVEITRRPRFLGVGGAFIRGTVGHALVDGLEPHPDEPMLIKKRWSAFHKTQLEHLLHSLGVSRVVLTGVQTPNCIRATAFDANSLDFEVVVAADATTASAPEIHEANLQDMARIGIAVEPASEIVRGLTAETQR